MWAPLTKLILTSCPNICQSDCNLLFYFSVRPHIYHMLSDRLVSFFSEKAFPGFDVLSFFLLIFLKNSLCIKKLNYLTSIMPLDFCLSLSLHLQNGK